MFKLKIISVPSLEFVKNHFDEVNLFCEKHKCNKIMMADEIGDDETFHDRFDIIPFEFPLPKMDFNIAAFPFKPEIDKDAQKYLFDTNDLLSDNFTGLKPTVKPEDQKWFNKF